MAASAAFVWPARALQAGTYRLLLRAVNPLERGLPLRFANTSQDAHRQGWLTLGTFTLRSSP